MLTDFRFAYTLPLLATLASCGGGGSSPVQTPELAQASITSGGGVSAAASVEVRGSLAHASVVGQSTGGVYTLGSMAGAGASQP